MVFFYWRGWQHYQCWSSWNRNQHSGWLGWREPFILSLITEPLQMILRISYFPLFIWSVLITSFREIGQLTTCSIVCTAYNWSHRQSGKCGMMHGLTELYNVCLNTNLASCTSSRYRLSWSLTMVQARWHQLLLLCLLVVLFNKQHNGPALWTHMNQTSILSLVLQELQVQTVSPIVVSSPNGNTDPTSAKAITRTSSFLIYPQVGGPEVTEAYAPQLSSNQLEYH